MSVGPSTMRGPWEGDGAPGAVCLLVNPSLLPSFSPVSVCWTCHNLDHNVFKGRPSSSTLYFLLTAQRHSHHGDL